MTRGLLLIAVAALIPVKLLCATLPLMNPSSDPGSRFGAEVKTLVNGNVVVTDPALTVNGFPLAGAVYLFNGASGALMSTLTGSAANEMVGGGGIGVLTNGNFVAISISSGAEASLGFGPTATFVNGTTGLSGVVSRSNSLLMGPGDAGAGGSTMVVTARWTGKRDGRRVRSRLGQCEIPVSCHFSPHSKRQPQKYRGYTTHPERDFQFYSPSERELPDPESGRGELW